MPLMVGDKCIRNACLADDTDVMKQEADAYSRGTCPSKLAYFNEVSKIESRKHVIGLFAPVGCKKAELLRELAKRSYFCESRHRMLSKYESERQVLTTIKPVVLCLSDTHKHNVVSLLDTPEHVDFLNTAINAIAHVDASFVLLAVEVFELVFLDEIIERSTQMGRTVCLLIDVPAGSCCEYVKLLMDRYGRKAQYFLVSVSEFRCCKIGSDGVSKALMDSRKTWDCLLSLFIYVNDCSPGFDHDVRVESPGKNASLPDPLSGSNTHSPIEILQLEGQTLIAIKSRCKLARGDEVYLDRAKVRVTKIFLPLFSSIMEIDAVDDKVVVLIAISDSSYFLKYIPEDTCSFVKAVVSDVKFPVTHALPLVHVDGNVIYSTGDLPLDFALFSLKLWGVRCKKLAVTARMYKTIETDRYRKTKIRGSNVSLSISRTSVTRITKPLISIFTKTVPDTSMQDFSSNASTCTPSSVVDTIIEKLSRPYFLPYANINLVIRNLDDNISIDEGNHLVDEVFSMLRDNISLVVPIYRFEITSHIDKLNIVQQVINDHEATVTDYKSFSWTQYMLIYGYVRVAHEQGFEAELRLKTLDQARFSKTFSHWEVISKIDKEFYRYLDVFKNVTSQAN